MLNLTNKEIVYLYRWLNLPLHGEELRFRTKFLSLIQPQRDEYNTVRQDVVQKHAKKDPEGNLLIEDGNYVFDEGQKEKFATDHANFLEQKTEYKIDDNTKKILKSIYNVLSIKLTKGMDIDEGAVYDAILTKFEEVLK